MNRDNILNLIINIFSLILIIVSLSGLRYKEMNAIVLVTFAINGLVCLLGAMYTRQNISIHRMIYIFSLFFFFIAPLMQYDSQMVFWQNWGLTGGYSSEDYFHANIIVLVFLLCFELGYRLRNNKVPSMRGKDLKKRIVINGSTRLVLMIASVLSLIITFFEGGLFSFQTASENQSVLGQFLLMVRFFPVAVLLFYILALKQKSVIGKSQIFLTVIIFVNVILYFPFSGTTARFVLFGVYLTIWAAIGSKSKLKSIFLLAVIIGFMYVFSAFNVFKSGSFADFHLVSSSSFVSVDFDAYQLLMLTQRYVRVFGSTHGMNLISTALCFIPRSIFSFRLEASGGMVAKAFGSRFLNVSSPLPAEMLLAGGNIAVVLISSIFGFLIRIIDTWSSSANFLNQGIFCIFAGFAIFLLRGSLLPAWSYTMSIMITLVGTYAVIIQCGKRDGKRVESVDRKIQKYMGEL
jgi:hypothetical protein